MFFVEIDHNIEMNFGANIAICTTTNDNSKAKLLLEKLMFPFLSNNIVRASFVWT